MKGLALFLLLVLAWSPGAWAAKITLYALFQDQAVLLIDGARQRLAAGERSPEGVLLVSTDTRREQAVIEVDGEQRVLQLGIVYEGKVSTPAAVTLYAESDGSYRATGSINGTPVSFLVDTGANIVAISSDLARRIGIDYTRGRAGMAMTASGPAPMYAIRLDRVRIGAIQLYNVEAGVLEGSQPATPLLGMSFLSRLNLNQDGTRLELVQRY